MGLTLVKYLYYTEGKFVYFFEMFSVELWTSAKIRCIRIKAAQSST